MTNFHVGQKITLVFSFGPMSIAKAIEKGVDLPKFEEVYTIREFDACCEHGSFLRVCEITNPLDPVDGLEPSFAAALFRPVITRKTDISIFKAMLTPSKEEVRA